MKALITGGGGFVGRALVELLCGEGHSVTAVSRNRYPELESLGARSLATDICDPEALAEAVQGHDTVFHVAAKTGVWGDRESYFKVNLEGTRNVLSACRAQGVERLVYTSSPSVCFDGKSHENASNDLPYARRFLCAYPESKAAAEAELLAANGVGGLATCALRPHLVIGPRDPHLVPRLVQRARAGRLMRVGSGRNVVSLTDVHNAARAHLDAASTLSAEAPHAGRAYFIAQQEPVLLWPWIDGILVALGERPVERGLSQRSATILGASLEAAWRLMRRKDEPPMTRFVAAQLATSHSYDLEPAKRDFGYREVFSMREATQRVVEWFKQQD